MAPHNQEQQNQITNLTEPIKIKLGALNIAHIAGCLLTAHSHPLIDANKLLLHSLLYKGLLCVGFHSSSLVLLHFIYCYCLSGLFDKIRGKINKYLGTKQTKESELGHTDPSLSMRDSL